MNYKPNVSVVIPSFNRGSVIQKAIKSVLKQSYQNYEIIIVDDGSIDDTEKVVCLLAKTDKRIIYKKHEKKLGAQAARNTGIKNAQGYWIAFLDSDDEYLPDSLSIRLNVANQKDVKVVHSECLVSDMNFKKKKFGVHPISGYVYFELLNKPSPFFQTMLVSKEAIEKIGYLDEAIASYQEWDTAIRLAKYYKFGFSSKPTFIYNLVGDDTISSDLYLDAKGYEYVIKKHSLCILFYLGANALSRHYHVAAKKYQVINYNVDILRCKGFAYLYGLFELSVFSFMLERIRKHGWFNRQSFDN